jgi:hypothetical protein
MTPPTQGQPRPTIQHAHFDDEEIPEAGNVIIHGHADGGKPHRHAYRMIGGPAPHMRWMPPSYIAKRESEEWA